ncbi:MAG TPA: universal stress protein [Pyrinomonadaceae bacterium]|nr:universal stress protein [Pyrinomonadaceae bacterium]
MSVKKKILIAYDGSACAEAALDDLQRAGLPDDAEAVVMSVTELWLPPVPPSSFEVIDLARAVQVPADLTHVYSQTSPAVQTAQTLADRGATRLRTNFPGWHVSTQTGVGSPRSELIQQTDNWKPDLIVLGSHGHSMLTRLVLGSVSQGVLTDAHTSVRIARGRVEEPNTPVRIVVGVDGSDASAAAVREVAARNWPAQSEVRIIAVTDPLQPGLIGSLIPPVRDFVNESNQEDRKWLNGLLEKSSKEFKSSNLKVTTQIVVGDPRRDLVAVAESWGADCIFVGSIGFNSRFERFVLGSVSATVAARAHCSVEVVRVPRVKDGTDPKPDYSRN